MEVIQDVEKAIKYVQGYESVHHQDQHIKGKEELLQEKVQ